MYDYFFIKKFIIAHILHLEIFHQTSYTLLNKNQKINKNSQNKN